MGAAASSRSGRRSDPAFGIGVGSVRGKCGAVEFGPSVITDDDAFQDAQDEIARANQSKSERKGQAKPVGNAASASTTTSKRVIERRRRSNTPPQVKKTPLPPPAPLMDASLGSSSSSSAATTKDGPAGGNAKPSRARNKTSMKEKVESFFIRGKSIKTKALLDPGTANGDDDTVRNSASNAARGNDAAGARVRSPPAGTELVYRQNQPSSIHDDADSILNIKTLNASSARPSPSHEHRRPAAGSSASTSGAQQQQQQQQQHRVATSLGNVALNNTNNDGAATLSGDSCMIARQGEEGVFDSYFLCAACAGNSLLSKLTAKGATSSSSPMGKMSSFKRQQLQRSGSSMTRTGGTSPKPDTSPSTSLRRSNSNLTSPSQSPSSSKAGVGGRGSGTCYIFVSSMGFRFYKPGGNGLFPFAQFPLDKIHSWAFEEKTKSFSFRFFELEEKQLVEVRFYTHTIIVH